MEKTSLGRLRGRQATGVVKNGAADGHHQDAGLSGHDPGGGIGDGENPLIAVYGPALEVILQPVGQLFRDENQLRYLAAFGISDGELLILHIHGSKLQNLAHPHAAPGHEFQHQTVSYFGGAEDDLVDGFFLMDLPARQFPWPKEFLEHGGAQEFWT